MSDLETSQLAGVLQSHFSGRPQLTTLPKGGGGPVDKIDWSKVDWQAIAKIVIQIISIFAKANV